MDRQTPKRLTAPIKKTRPCRLAPSPSETNLMVDSHSTTSSLAPQEEERCAFCGTDLTLYQMGVKWICRDHIAFVVSLAANTVFRDLVSYKRDFEKVLL